MTVMQPPLAPIPDHLLSLYTKLRIALAFALFVVALLVAYQFLFPTIATSFDFRNPKSSKNLIFDPRSEDTTPRTNGKIESAGQLIANTSPLGDFSQLTTTVKLEKKSALPTAIDVSLVKNYRAFLYPLGDPVTDFPSAELYRIDTTYYELRDGTLYPFVSEAAFRSRYGEERAVSATSEWRDQYPLAQTFIGFRVGSLLSFADGVYVVTSETDIRPIGSAEIFLALGYSFAAVTPVNEEDLGIYKRGRIFLMGAAHPDGTLFEDRESGALYLIEAQRRRPITPGAYHDFLRSRMTPVLASEVDVTAPAQCSDTPGIFPGTLSCTLALDSYRNQLGSDYEVRLSNPDVAIDIATLELAFETRLDAANMKTLLAKVKQRVLSRFGLSTP